MADKSKLIDINGLSTFLGGVRDEMAEITVTKQKVIDALEYTPVNPSDIITDTQINALFS